MAKSKQYIGDRKNQTKAPEIPGRIKDYKQSRLGMAFEKRIEITNKIYFYDGLATIQKIPTPTKVTRGKVIRERSTVDFMGMIHGDKAVPLAFEAKETSNKTAFPLYSHGSEMVKRHQREFLMNWENGGGTAFVLIHFSQIGTCYRVPAWFIDECYKLAENGGRKSIPYSEFSEYSACYEVDIDDYLQLGG